MDRISRKGSIADIDQDRGSKSCSGPQGQRKHMMSQAKHKARPGGRRGVLGLQLGQGGFGAKGGFRGAWSG